MTNRATTPTTPDGLRRAVREHYAAAARTASGCCGGAAGPVDVPFGATLYGADDREAVPEGALLASLGCGNPTALAELSPGEDVLDLGSGGGLDVLLSARRVGPTGMAYGVDMTAEMLELAEANRRAAGVDNARFLSGTIEAVPLPDATVDVVISNCVVNLSGDKEAVFREAFRVLRPGGRFAVSDIVLTRPLPPGAERVVRLWTGCVAGALTRDDYVAGLSRAGFEAAEVETTQVYDADGLRALAEGMDPADLPAGTTLDDLVRDLDGAVSGAFIRARRPAGARTSG
ncbi:MAG: arsenite methyltransferase [Candidatus Nanopelagicales bacterium]